jgi:hypothetical protein
MIGEPYDCNAPYGHPFLLSAQHLHYRDGCGGSGEGVEQWSNTRDQLIRE